MADLYLCRPEILKDDDALKGLISDIFRVFGETDGKVAVFPGESEGRIGFFRLKESRISFHTLPSLNYFAFEIFVMGKTDPNYLSEYLVEKISPQVVTIREFSRAEHLESE